MQHSAFHSCWVLDLTRVHNKNLERLEGHSQDGKKTLEHPAHACKDLLPHWRWAWKGLKRIMNVLDYTDLERLLFLSNSSCVLWINKLGAFCDGQTQKCLQLYSNTWQTWCTSLSMELHFQVEPDFANKPSLSLEFSPNPVTRPSHPSCWCRHVFQLFHPCIFESSERH